MSQSAKLATSVSGVGNLRRIQAKMSRLNDMPVVYQRAMYYTFVELPDVFCLLDVISVVPKDFAYSHNDFVKF